MAGAEQKGWKDIGQQEHAWSVVAASWPMSRAGVKGGGVARRAL